MNQVSSRMAASASNAGRTHAGVGSGAAVGFGFAGCLPAMHLLVALRPECGALLHIETRVQEFGQIERAVGLLRIVLQVIAALRVQAVEDLRRRWTLRHCDTLACWCRVTGQQRSPR